MKTTIKKGIVDNELILTMDFKIEELRKAIWNTIHKENRGLSDCDISMVLGIINYELIHHTIA